MFGKPFNEKRPYGTVHGESRFAYEQDGQMFNVQKQPVDALGNVLQLRPSKADVEEQPDAPPPPDDNPEDDVPEDEKEFDILAWARGDDALQSTPFSKVKAEAARLVEDHTKLTSKAAVKKAVLEHYNIDAAD